MRARAPACVRNNKNLIRANYILLLCVRAYLVETICASVAARAATAVGDRQGRGNRDRRGRGERVLPSRSPAAPAAGARRRRRLYARDSGASIIL